MGGMNPNHICILTTTHPIDDVRVNYKFAKTFLAEGFRVSWVGPDHSFFERGQGSLQGMEPQLFQARAGKIGRLSNIRRTRKQAPAVSGVHVYYCPEPDSAAVALSLAGRTGARVILDIHEMYHDAMLARWARGVAFRVLSPLLRAKIKRICSQCDLVVGVSRAVLNPYRDAPVKQMVVRSCAPVMFAKCVPADVCSAGRTTLTLMHGKSTLNRGTLELLEALALANKRVSGLRVAMLNMFADQAEPFGAKQLMERMRALGVERSVDFRPAVPFHQMPEMLRSCDVGLIAWNRRFGTEILPNRLFEYMACGLAVVAPTYSGEIARIIEAEKCGLLADFENPQSIADTMVYLREHPSECRQMGIRARKAFLERHNWDVEVKPLISEINRWCSELNV